MELEQLDLTTPIQPRLPGHPIPLTAIQRRIWNRSLDLNGTRPSLRLCATAVRILGRFDPVLFKQSVDAVVRRHESLRSRFVSIDGVPHQEVAPGAHSFNIVELLQLDPATADQEVMRQAQDFIDRPIDLGVGPLFEVRLWKLRDDDHVLVMLIDHMISDGMSNGILTGEIWKSYEHVVRGEPLDLPALPVQFGDYAVWQERTRQSWMREHAEFWRRHLSDARPTGIPFQHHSSDGIQPVGLTAHIPFGEALTARLRKAAQGERSLLSIFILAAYAVVISSWSRQQDLLIAFPAHGRNQPVLRNMVGFVANVLHLRVPVLGHETLRDLLSRVRDEVAAALRHRDFDRVPDFIPECTTDVMFNWQTTHSIRGAVEHHTILEFATALDTLHSSQRERADLQPEKPQILPLPARTPSNLKFSPVIFDLPASLHMAVAYRPDLIALTTVRAVCRNLMFVAEQLAESPTQRVSSVLSELERGRSSQTGAAIHRADCAQ
jgi:hypothetical protein